MGSDPGPYDLSQTYLRLLRNGSAEPLPVGPEFWQDISSGRLGNFHNQFLISAHSFDRDWSSWEMQPNGDEFVFLISGKVESVMEHDGQEKVLSLEQSGSYVIIPRATWHTVRVRAPSTMLFITPGEGTQNRPV